MAEKTKQKRLQNKQERNKNKQERNAEKAEAESEKSFSREKLVQEILREAKVLNIAPGAAEEYAKKVAEKTEKWVEKRGGVTESDISRVVAKEMEKYSRDLSFVYQNRGKII